MSAFLSRLRNSNEMDAATLAEMNRRNRQIESSIERDRKLEEGTIKLLLLGAAESGKSTILKQMKIIHDNGFAPEEMRAKREIVYANAIQSMVSILNGMHDLCIQFSRDESLDYEAHLRQLLEEKKETGRFSEYTYSALTALWKDKGIQVALSRRADFYLPDCAEYFLEQLPRIYDEEYIPTPQDILHTRVATMGVIEVTFMMKNKNWRVFDVGGQRSQRKKWIHCFDDVKAVIYVVALSEYDQVLLEDLSTNRMKESLQLFGQVCNNKHFVNTNMILFLNKKDLFALKIGRGTSLRLAFPDYKGAEDYDGAAVFIENKFLEVNKNPNKSIYCHQTCATDTEQVEFVLDSTLDTILSAKLKGCGLY